MLTQHNLEALSNRGLVDAVIGLKTELRRLKVENMVFEHFLEDNDTSFIDFSSGYLPNKSESSGTKDSCTDSQSTSEATSSSMSEGMTFSGPRINLEEKLELAAMEEETLKNEMAHYNKLFHREWNELLVSVEESEIHYGDILRTRDDFEYRVVERPSSQRKIAVQIPAERFVKFMNDWQNRARALLEKLRVKVNNQKVQLRKLKEARDIKIPLYRHVEEVDIQVLKMQLTDMKDELQMKKSLWGETKNILNLFSRQITKMRMRLDSQNAETSYLTKNMLESKVVKEKYEKELEKLQGHIENLTTKRKQINNLIAKYECHSVIEYAYARNQLNELLQREKKWHVKATVQQNAIKCYRTILRQCKRKHRN